MVNGHESFSSMGCDDCCKKTTKVCGDRKLFDSPSYMFRDRKYTKGFYQEKDTDYSECEDTRKKTCENGRKQEVRSSCYFNKHTHVPTINKTTIKNYKHSDDRKNMVTRVQKDHLPKKSKNKDKLNLQKFAKNSRNLHKEHDLYVKPKNPKLKEDNPLRVIYKKKFECLKQNCKTMKSLSQCHTNDKDVKFKAQKEETAAYMKCLPPKKDVCRYITSTQEDMDDSSNDSIGTLNDYNVVHNTINICKKCNQKELGMLIGIRSKNRSKEEVRDEGNTEQSSEESDNDHQNGSDDESMMTMLKPYKKRLIHHLEKPSDEKSDCSSLSPRSTSSSASIEEKKEKDEAARRARKIWKKKISRKQFRHDDIQIFKPGNDPSPCLLKRKDAHQNNQKSETVTKEAITESIVTTLAGQKKFIESSNDTKRIVSFAEKQKSDKRSHESVSGKHNLPAIVLETPTIRRRSHDNTITSTTGLLKTSETSTVGEENNNNHIEEQSPAEENIIDHTGKQPPSEENNNSLSRRQSIDMPSLTYEDTYKMSNGPKPITKRRQTVACSEFAPGNILEQSMRKTREEKRAFSDMPVTNNFDRSYTIADNMDSPIDMSTKNSNTYNLAPSNSNSILSNDTHSLPAFAREQKSFLPILNYPQRSNSFSRENVNSTGSPQNISHNMNPFLPVTHTQPYFFHQDPIAAINYPEIYNQMQRIRQTINPQPKLKPKDIYPDDHLVRSYVKTLNAYMSQEFSNDILLRTSHLYQQINSLLLDNRLSTKVRQLGQKTLNETYGYVAHKLPTLNIAQSMMSVVFPHHNSNNKDQPISPQFRKKISDVGYLSTNSVTSQIANQSTANMFSRPEFETRDFGNNITRNNFQQPVNEKLAKPIQSIFPPTSINSSKVYPHNSVSMNEWRQNIPEMPNYSFRNAPRFTDSSEKDTRVSHYPAQEEKINRNQGSGLEGLRRHFQNKYPDRPIFGKHNFRISPENNIKVPDELQIIPQPIKIPDAVLYKNNNNNHLTFDRKKPVTIGSNSTGTVKERSLFRPAVLVADKSMQITKETTNSANFNNTMSSLNGKTYAKPDEVVLEKVCEGSKSNPSSVTNENKTSSEIVEITKIKDNETQVKVEEEEFMDLLQRIKSKISNEKQKMLILNEIGLAKKEEKHFIENMEPIEINDDSDDDTSKTTGRRSAGLKRKVEEDSTEDSSKSVNDAASERAKKTKESPEEPKKTAKDVNKNYLFTKNSKENLINKPNTTPVCVNSKFIQNNVIIIEDESVIDKPLPDVHTASPSLPTTVKKQSDKPSKLISVKSNIHKSSKPIYSPEIEPISPVGNEKCFTYPLEKTPRNYSEPIVVQSSPRINISSPASVDSSKNNYFSPNRRISIDTVSNLSDHSYHEEDRSSVNSASSEKIPPKGKLCYVRENNTFIRYFDDTQIDLFMKNLNIRDEEVLKQMGIDPVKYKECRPNYDLHTGRTETIKIPKDVVFSNKEDISDVEEYVKERNLVELNAPKDFSAFYVYVTGYQIVRNNNPISFQTFLTMYNTNGLKQLLIKYMKSE